MRIGIYLGRHNGQGGGIGVYARAMVSEFVNILRKSESCHHELVIYGDNVMLTSEFIHELSLSSSFVKIADKSMWHGAYDYFSNQSHSVRIRVLVRILPNIFGRKGSTISDQFIVPYYAYLDRLNVLHCLANIAMVLKVCKQIVTMHDLYQAWPPLLEEPSRSGAGALPSFYKTLFRVQFKNVDCIITDISEVRDEIVARFSVDRNKIETVPLGLDSVFVNHIASKNSQSETMEWDKRCNEFVKELHESYLIKSGYTLLFASFDKRKNFKRNLLAWCKLPVAFQSNGLVIVGDSKECQRYVFDIITGEGATQDREIELAKFIVFLPHIERSRMPFLYEQAGVLLNATLAEGFGLPAYEANALGVNVVTGSLESLVAIRTSCVYECNAYSEQSIYEALLAACKHAKHGSSCLPDDCKEAITVRTMSQCAMETWGIYQQYAVRENSTVS